MPETADVVVIGGDPAALAAVYRLAATPGLRVVLLQDRAGLDAAPSRRRRRWRRCRRSSAATRCASTGWRDRGNRGWGYADVLQSFKRLERYEAGASQTAAAPGRCR